MKSNIFQLSHGFAQPREWPNLILKKLRGACCKWKVSAQNHIAPSSMPQGLGPLIFPGCSAFLHRAKDYTISPTPGNRCKILSVMVSAPVYPQFICWKISLWKSCHLTSNKQVRSCILLRSYYHTEHSVRASCWEKKYKVTDLKFKLLEWKDENLMKEKQLGLGRK